MRAFLDLCALAAGFIILTIHFGWVAALGFVCLAYYSKSFTKE